MIQSLSERLTSLPIHFEVRRYELFELMVCLTFSMSYDLPDRFSVDCSIRVDSVLPE